MTDEVLPPAKPKRPPPKRAPSGGGLKHNITGQRLNISGLTVEQEAYARCRAMGMGRKESADASGIKLSTTRDWEAPTGHHGTKIVDRINELAAIAQNNAILKSGLDRQWVISRLMTVVERCMKAEPVMDKKGTPTGEYVFDSSGANNALRMLGDTLGLFKPQAKEPGDELAHLTDDEIARIAQELASQTGLLGPPA